MKYHLLLAAGLSLTTAAFTASASTQALAGSVRPGHNLSQDIDKAQAKGKLTFEQSTQLKAEETEIRNKKQKLIDNNHGKLSLGDRKTIHRDFADLRKKMNQIEIAKGNNSVKNIGDSRIESPTPQTASASKSDMRIAQRLRKNLIADKTLSTDAKNIKIITNNGTVTLRGPVANADEKNKITGLAGECVGADHVLDQLDVVTNSKTTK